MDLHRKPLREKIICFYPPFPDQPRKALPFYSLKPQPPENAKVFPIPTAVCQR